MVSPPFSKSAILLITALILVQGAAALTFEQAPLNPAFVAYTDGLDSGEINQASINTLADPSPENEPDAPYATGLLPSPALAFWPDGYAAGTANDDTALPARFDLRDVDRVTPPRDQGKAGSCWAFATYGSLESTYLTDTETAENFSENNMKNLCSDEYQDGFDRTPYDGGFAFTSNAYLVRGSGPVMEEEDRYALPYPSNSSPTNLAPVLDVRDVTLLPPRTGPLENDLYKETIMNEGAIWVSFIVNWSCFADNYTTYYWPGNEYTSDGGHAVTLVGWDDAFPKESFAVTPPGDGAFILKNSWGTSAGENGFFYISYYDPVVGRLAHASDEPHDYTYYNTPGALYTGVPAVEDKHIYQYDPLGWTTSIGTGMNTLMMGLNVFTADRYEEVTDVSFYTREPGTQYVAAVFTGSAPPVDDDMPVAWISGTTALPGYHTVTLPDTVPLTPGEEFSVLLVVFSPTDTHPLVVEKPIDGYSSGATAEPGESYVSIDLANWEDLTDIHGFEDTNVCIKAHTRPVTVVPRDYPTIMAAVNVSASGDTIFVEAGTYPERITLEKPLTLLGVGTPVISTAEYDIGALVRADNITLAGFSFEGEEHSFGGISIQGNDTTIYDTEISGYVCGIRFSNTERLTMSDTALHDNLINIDSFSCSQNPENVIDETVTLDGRPLIYRESVSGETIDTSTNAGIVICVNCMDMTIRDTDTMHVGEGVSLHYCRDIIVENVTTNEAMEGIRARHSTNIVIRDSAFGPDVWNGISVRNISGLQVQDNNIACLPDGTGALLYESDNVTMTGNTIAGDLESVGIWAQGFRDSVISRNTITEGTEYGIGITLGNNLAVNANTIHTTDTGIQAGGVQTITISDNTLQCYNSSPGLVISVRGAVISGNTAKNCSVQSMLTLTDSVVHDNHFSGASYPVILARNAQEDVFVYRNDFVLTEGHAGINAAILHTAADEQSPENPEWKETLEQIRIPDNTVQIDWSCDDTYETMGTASIIMTAGEEVVAHSPVWHTPTETGYWYGGQMNTAFLGNYWSTYNGTDTAHDGIGDTPFVISDISTDNSPLMDLSKWYPNSRPSNPSDDDPSAEIDNAQVLSAGEPVTLSFTGSAVQTITVTTKGDEEKILLALTPTGTGPDGLTGPVYEYFSATLRGTNDDGIDEAVFSFRVAAAWLKAEGLLPADMALCRFHNETWQELPATVVRKDNQWIYYEAVSPGFSSFAIAAGDGHSVVIPTGPTVPDVDSTNNTVPVTTEYGNETTTEPWVTVTIPEEGDTGTSAERTTPQESPLGFITVIGGAAGAALLFRKQ